MRITKDIDICELADEICSDELEKLLDTFMDESTLDSVVGSYIDDLDGAEDIIRRHYKDIIRKYLRWKEAKLSADDMLKLGLTSEECKDADIPVEYMVDENGRKFIWIKEDPRQMTLFENAGEGKTKKYI